jgi:hypothetical protein
VKSPLISALAFFLLLFISGCHHPAQVASPPAPAPPTNAPDVVLGPGPASFKFVAYGDTRFTDPDLLGEKASSHFVRVAIVDAIAKTKPAFVVITGDIPWRGAVSEDWQAFDSETKPIADAHIPILPTLGNHEYYNRLFRRSRESGLDNYYARFPQIPHRPGAPWYAARYANCYFLFLDSDDDDSAGSPQLQWLQKQLQSIPVDIDFVFPIIHRPPYTAATDGLHRPRAAELAIAHILEDRQKLAPRPQIVMFAGHVHNYERYVHGGVDYIVTGGGGASPHPLKRSPDDLYKPIALDGPEYHYCVVSIDHQELKLEMFRLSETDHKAKFDVRDSFEVRVAAK